MRKLTLNHKPELTRVTVEDGVIGEGPRARAVVCLNVTYFDLLLTCGAYLSVTQSRDLVVWLDQWLVQQTAKKKTRNMAKPRNKKEK